MSEAKLQRIQYELAPNGFEPTAPEQLYNVFDQTEIDHDQLLDRYHEANAFRKVFQDRRGMNHEITFFNMDSQDNGLILKPTTSFSGTLKNPGNVMEVAVAATMNPDKAYALWSSDGNYPTGHMSSDDRKYRRKTGRYTKDGEAVDSVKYFVEVLDEIDATPDYLIADQEAGRVALGIASALGANSLKGVYLNGIDGISPGASYVKAPFTEDMQSRVRRRRSTDGKVGDLTPANIKELKEHMPDVYKGIGKVAHLAPLPLLLFPKDVRDKIGFTLGARGHNNLDDLDDHAVFQDMSAALQNQATNFYLQFNEKSKPHDMDDCIRFGKLVLDNLPANKQTDRGITILQGTGNWTESTDAPQDAAAIQKYVFESA